MIRRPTSASDSNIEIMDEGFLIRVALELEDAEHAATIVNTVVDTLP